MFVWILVKHLLHRTKCTCKLVSLRPISFLRCTTIRAVSTSNPSSLHRLGLNSRGCPIGYQYPNLKLFRHRYRHLNHSSWHACISGIQKVLKYRHPEKRTPLWCFFHSRSIQVHLLCEQIK